MPFDLVMDLQPPKPARVQSIVDELFLPLLQAHARVQQHGLHRIEGKKKWNPYAPGDGPFSSHLS